MSFATMIAVVPLGAMLLGGVAGLVLGRRLTPRVALWVLGVVVVASIALLVRLAMVQPGHEETAFMPFVWLTGGLFPALFGGILGWLAGRAWAKRGTK